MLVGIEAKIDFLSEGYMSDENREAYEKWLDDPNIVLGQGQGRHDALKFKIISYYYKYKDEWLDLTDEQRFQRAWDWNVAHCKPAKPKEEFDNLVKWTIETHRERRDELHSKVKEEKEDKPKQAALLVKISEKSCKELFHDQHQTPYAAVISGDHIESIPLGNKKFKNYICGAYYEAFGSVPNFESIGGAINVLKYKAAFKGAMIPLHLRVARDGNDILYDLTDAGWNVIRVAPQGWNIEKSPIIFRRYSSQLGQVLPSSTYEDDIFDQFMKLLNIEDNDSKLLLKCYIIALFVPGIQKAILMLHGEQGSAKTTLQELIKTLVDPSSILTLAFPRDTNEFIQGLAHNYIAYFDNISNIQEWISNILCRAVTGSGFSKRMLFSDDDDIIYNFKRCIGFNGINLAATKADLLDRGLIIQLSKISKDKRRESSEIWTEFEIIRPKLLGYILDILVKVLATISSVKLSVLPRMADFAKVCETISRCMRNEPDVFIKAYDRNIQLQTEQVLESNVIALVIVKFMDNRQEWIGSATALLSNMETLAATMKVNTKSKMWPKAPHILIRRLNEVKATLEDVGIFITRGLDKQSKVKTVEIRKKALLSLPSLQEEKSAEITSGSSNDTGNDTLTSTKIALPKDEQKHAQIGGGNASNGSNDTLRGSTESYNKNIFSKRYVAFDFEWSQETSSQLFAAAFVDSDGNTKTLHISDYSGSANPEAELVKRINQQLLTYDFSIGWYSTGVARYHEDTQEYLDGVDSDLTILHNRCAANDVDSIVGFNSAGKPYIRCQTHIDLYNVFSKPMIQTTIFKNAYRTLSLDEVSKAILADTSHAGLVLGKYKGLTGKDVQSLQVEEQKKYVLRDAELVMQLSKHNNSNVLDAMKSISEITGLDFERVCRTGLSTWWAAIFDKMAYDGEGGVALASLFYKTKEKLELQYIGGLVLQPKKGLYHNLIVADVTSLYPTMAIIYNISFDTVNCECCRNDLHCRISEDITKDCRMQEEYWICRQKEGAFPKKLNVFKQERLEQKRLGNQDRQLALKILINGGYGVFGSQYFKYYDPRIAELITAYGRYTISKMKDIAQNMGFDIVYGDTDSLFLNYINMNTAETEAISRFKEECNKQLGVEVEHAKTYQTAIISEKKKHYIGWTGIEGREPDIVGMEGDKNDRPKWINIVFRQIAYDILVSNDPIASLKRAVADLELGNVNPELLKRSIRLSKNPEEYENENDRKRKLGLAVGARKGDVVEYFETDNNKEGYSLNPQDISTNKYKIMLWKAVKDILEIAGYDITALERELFETSKISHMAMPSRGVAGSSSYTGANQVAKNNTTSEKIWQKN